MILDFLTQSPRYHHLGPLWKLGFDFLQNLPSDAPDERIELDGERLVAIVQSYETHDPATRFFEAHRRYVDIQYIISGRETLYFTPVDTLTVDVPFSEAKDVTKYHIIPDAESVILSAGKFMVLWQDEAHMPSCQVVPGRPEAVRKVVLKLEA
ncbi:YhcH/YjgK/YiaL family protein [Terrimicrobium sacchariphilum]|jgi:YhcH/YjgK/YiaL family protein|uniref:YhcH/YjgK/YiaL family protein n=1 Tax=Terrimicrobium sacchariphilum TaxID=690879 RepID=A0A146GAF2_TERSA|nr:YhcH/YjgK/YiaL family protein [Terrimicrobium sacchariphilum]GAT34430.1 YhcH/YjgK/YiaL family protein [Terrimicrobium sacchariphilum]